ncbi:Hypothetical predicted protein [Mytilus galloprovincialis]|uniref:Gla domain-containing protein n=1 Tax=Mytilus galloprovincialis TaxID=29158 RepID=A0A8B6BHJ0_MYTGA|nr:Hypothetical predicted protein [Mytilus galloprovincialis]
MITVGLLIRVSSICFVLGKSEQHDNQLPKIVNEKHPTKATPGVFMGKEKALDFLQAPHRQKRWDSNLGEECHSEKCTYEEILEYFEENDSSAVSIGTVFY